MTKRERMNAAFDEQIRDMRQAEALGISLAEYHRQKREPRRCRICHEQERSDGLYTTIAPHLGICAECINRYVMSDRNQSRKRARA